MKFPLSTERIPNNTVIYNDGFQIPIQFVLSNERKKNETQKEGRTRNNRKTETAVEISSSSTFFRHGFLLFFLFFRRGFEVRRKKCLRISLNRDEKKGTGTDLQTKEGQKKNDKSNFTAHL